MVGSWDTAGELARNTLLSYQRMRRACAHPTATESGPRAQPTERHTRNCNNILIRYLNTPAKHGFAIISALLLLALPAAGDTTYTVRPGDSVWSIARKHGLSYLSVLRTNSLGKSTIIRPGQQLVIPDTAASSPTPADARPQATDTDGRPIHVVRQGESLWLIARAHGITVRALAEENGLRPTGVLRVGSRLKIPSAPEASQQSADDVSPDPQADEPEVSLTHFVRQGESLWTIARVHGTSVQALAAANQLRPENILRAGRELTIPELDSAEASAESAPTRPYVVQNGDCLWEIAHRHGTTVQALTAANGLDPDRVLRVGSVLLVPQSADDADAAAPEGQHRFVQAALQYQGVRYRYGGMSTRGMDCSGLVALVLRNYGIDAPHNSKALYRLGKGVSRENLQPGDLIFFHTTRPGISHVGIYIGDGEFIHASSSKGRVRIDRLDQGYYSRAFVGAKRLS